MFGSGNGVFQKSDALNYNITSEMIHPLMLRNCEEIVKSFLTFYLLTTTIFFIMLPLAAVSSL